MVSHGLRRRKRRAWEAVVALLAVGLIVHSVLGLILREVAPHAVRPPLLPGRAAVSAALVVALVRREFYAVGDRRSRWRALWVLCCLAVADGLIGLAYLALSRGLDADTPWQRVHSVVASWRILWPGHVRLT